MNRRDLLGGASTGVLGAGLGAAATAAPLPPPVNREMRGAWVATVDNIDWPSKPGVPTAQAQQELRAILDRCAALRFNTVVFQVRPACDALYASELEPWSDYLTGTLGVAPSPAWDPLAFAVDEAHQRGLELHAWFNPYRAHHFTSKSPLSANHLARTRPELVRTYGRYLWLDPGEPAVQDHTTAVVLDVVRRYDLDGIHIDDYFYPYKEKDPAGKEIPFPDEPSWERYQKEGGGLARDDWRRRNVDTLVHRLHREIRKQKPWVRFGVSPFGIWRPGNPMQIKGFDAYAELYADAKKWLNEGWVDYFVPQLYWKIDPPAQSYPVLLNWWASENTRKRLLVAGNYSGRVGEGAWPAEELLEQVRVTRKHPGAGGNVHFSMKSLMRPGGIGDLLADRLYQEPALTPEHWAASHRPAAPKLTFDAPSGVWKWKPGKGNTVRWWVLQTQGKDNRWATRILGGKTLEITGSVIPAGGVIALSAVDRFGRQSHVTLGRADRGS